MKKNSVQITVLEFPDTIRENPEIYISGGPLQCLQEIVDNSIDEFKAGYATTIDITIDDNYVTVIDDGRGIPTEKSSDPKYKNISMVELALGRLSAGGKYDGREGSYNMATGGRHGMGSSCVNALSLYFEAIIKQNKQVWQIGWKNGILHTPLKVIHKLRKDVTGTTIKYKLDPQFFPEELNKADVINYCKQMIYINPELKINLTILGKHYKMVSKGGLKDYLDDLLTNKTAVTKKSFVIADDLDNTGTDLKSPLSIDLQATYTNSYTSEILSFVNAIVTKDGGSHVQGLQQGISAALRQYALEKKKIKEATELEIGDSLIGILAIISIQVKNPSYNKQAKDQLSMPTVKTLIQNLVKTKFYEYLKKHSTDANAILAKALASKNEREKIKQARDTARGIKKISTKSMTIGKLKDCHIKDPEKAELWIVEGDSAGGSCVLGRDTEYQAILPIFGKVLNVSKTSIIDVVHNIKLGMIIAAMNCGVDDKFDFEALRYHKIIIAVDADVDGRHGICLYISFFYKHMPALIEHGCLYVACPPLYKAIKGNKAKYFYTTDELNKAKLDNGYNITYLKGLGEMSPELLWDTTMNPEHRHLYRVTIDDAKSAEEMINICMGNDVAIRKQYLLENIKF